MRNLEQEDEDSFKRQFGKYVTLGVNADAVSIYIGSYSYFFTLVRTSDQITVHTLIVCSVETGQNCLAMFTVNT